MEPTPLTPQDLPGATPKDSAPKNPFDLGSILLPKKETPGQTPASAQRINAGVLLEQEEHATLLTPTPPVDATTPAASVAPTPAEPPKEQTVVQPIETYQHDIEDLVKDKNVSILSVAAAEAERRGSQQANAEASNTPALPSTLLKNIALYGLGFLLLAGASGALAYIVERPTSVSMPAAPATPFIAVDDTKIITISPDVSRSSFVSTLTAAKQATALSLGLMSRLLVTVASTSAPNQTPEAMSAQSFFTLMAPNMPQDLLLTIRPNYLLGVHVYENNQPFLIMSVDSYEQAYAGMLAWEPYLQQDLSPLFAYTPSAHIPEQGVASSTATPQQFIQTGFTDKVVENHDSRVIQNDTGDVSLLWTFLDRNTLVITTNAATLREIISRLKQAPVTTVPVQ